MPNEQHKIRVPPEPATPGTEPPLSKLEKIALLRSKLTPAAASSPNTGLSEAQLRLWKLEESSPLHPVHVFALVYYLRGPVDKEVLAEAIARVASHYKALRVRVATAGSGQLFFEEVQPPVMEHRRAAPENVDLDSPPLAAALRAEAARPIDPGAGPGWYAVLFECGPDSHALLLKFHHIFADRWSVGVFIGSLGKAWRNLLEGGPPFGTDVAVELPDLNPTEDRAALTVWWKNRFAKPAPMLGIPGAHRQEAFSDYKGQRIRSRLEPETLAALKDLARAESATLFPLILAAVAAMLYRHTGQEDMIVCTPMTGRHRSGTRNAIGYFNNIVPLRLDLSGDPVFRALIARAAAEARDVFVHQDLPFHAIAELPELSATKIARCLIAVQNIPGLELDVPGVETRYEDVANGAANFELAVFIEEKSGGCDVLLDYKTATLTASAADALKERFFEVIRLVTANPDLRLSDLPLYPDPSAPDSSSLDDVPPASEIDHSARNLMEQRMVEVWRTLFRNTSVHADSHFFDLGGDSLRAARLFTQIEREFGHQLPLASLFEVQTPRQLVEKMRDLAWVAPWLSLIPIKSAGSRPPLFLVHGGGGNVLSFRRLAECLGGDQPVYSLQAQGLRRGERPIGTIEEMAARYVESVRRLRPHGPYLLAGHSLGAAIAYEMAQRFVAAGERVAFVGLFDHPGPNVRITLLDWLRVHAMNVAMLPSRERFAYIWRGVVWRVRVTRARRRMNDLKAPPEQGEAKTGWSSLDILEQSLRALRDYEVKPWPGRITVFRARKGPPAIRSDPNGGWGGVAGGGLEIHNLQGTHMSMFEEPGVLELGAVLSRCIEQLDLSD